MVAALPECATNCERRRRVIQVTLADAHHAEIAGVALYGEAEIIRTDPCPAHVGNGYVAVVLRDHEQLAQSTASTSSAAFNLPGLWRALAQSVGPVPLLRRKWADRSRNQLRA